MHFTLFVLISDLKDYFGSLKLIEDIECCIMFLIWLQEGKKELATDNGVWPVLPEVSDLLEINTIDSMDSNDLDVGRHGKHLNLKEGKSRPLDSWDRDESKDVVGNEDNFDLNGPLYSDQEQVKHLHYSTRVNH